MSSGATVRVLDDAAALALDLRGTILVEASAGTGKTHAIGNLYLRAVLAGHPVRHILVVTFTKAATEELRGRIRARLHGALRALRHAEGTRDDAFLRLWLATLDEAGRREAELLLRVAVTTMDEAAIYTIHGFCQRVLTEHAFASGQPFESEFLQDDGPLWDEAIKDWWRRHTEALDTAALRRFLHAVGDLDRLIALQRPLRRPGVRLIPEGDVLQPLEEAFAELRGLWRTQRTAAEALIASDRFYHRGHYSSAKLPQLFERVDRLLEEVDILASDGSLPDLEALSWQVLSTKMKQAESVDCPNPLFAQVDRVLALARAVPNRRRLHALRMAHEAAAQAVAARKRQLGVMAFDDLLTALRRALLERDSGLAETLRAQFPVAMIDEFQDTDAVQYGIFRAIYGAGGALLLIGDPKQAIYSFRGGDIFTYIRASRDTTARYTLDRNWRSTEGLVAAVNALFSRRESPFLFDAISFTPVLAAAQGVASLRRDGREVAPMTLWQLPRGDDGKPLAKGDAFALLYERTADEIARLLADGRRGRALLGDVAVAPSHIAVLVRGHREGIGVRQALAARGVDAGISGRHSVFASEEAEGLRIVLAAVADCYDRMRLRQALASPLLGLDHREIHEVLHDEARWLAWGAALAALHESWQQRGFMAAFQGLLRLPLLAEQLARGPQAERRMSNLLHLGELLQQASASVAGMEGLVGWLARRVADPDQGGEEAELRLERDADLVQIVTIHGSKGLAYPIVFVPGFWSCYPAAFDRGKLLPFYDEQREAHVLDAAWEHAHLCRAERERLAEDMRLLYVALTRASAKLYLAWGHAGNAAQTALGWLLHSDQEVAALSRALPCAFDDGADLDGVLRELAAEQPGVIELQPLSLEGEVFCLPPEETTPEPPQAAHYDGVRGVEWRIVSFSALTRGLHQPRPLPPRRETEETPFAFPAGSRVGLFLHALLEVVDFQGDVRAQAADFAARHAVRYGVDGVDAEAVGAWMAAVVATPLLPSGLRLADLPAAARLNELSFDFSVAELRPDRLDQLLAGAGAPPLQAGACRGFMTGVIDLVFRHEGRFFVVDYKSNHLGYALDDYAPPALRAAILERRYDLQCLIYTLALHRYLRLRLPDYDYDRHMGGVLYLFLRGMRPEHGPRYGVYADQPPRVLVETLDREVFAPLEVAAR